MQRVDFYLAPGQPVEAVIPQVAKKALAAGERMLVVSADEEQLARLDHTLWEAHPEDFLAHGPAGDRHAARQPILLSASCVAENQARLVALADGAWREEAESFERVLLFFDEAGRTPARETWRRLDQREGVERAFHEHDGRRWVRKG